MAQRTKSWFFETPESTSYSRLSKNNKPSKSTFYDVLDSVCLKVEDGDTAALTQQGLVKLATDANVKTRTSASSGTKQTVVRPHQLAMLTLGDDTEATIAAGAQTYEGLKLTGVSKTVGSDQRLNFKLEFDPNSLSTATPVAATDYFIFEDADDSNAPKKALISALSSLMGGYWSLTSTNLSPTSDTYDLKLLKDMFFDGVSDAYLFVDADASGDGHDLYIHSGNAGGAAFNGGDIYLYGGVKTGAGADGNTYLLYNGASTVGKMGIGGAADTSYLIKVHGGVWATGKCKVGTGGSGAVTHTAMLDTDGEILIKTTKEMMDEVVGSVLAADAVPYFDGASWTSQANAGAKLQYITGLTSDAQTQISSKITAGAAAIVNADVSATAAIAGSKIAVGSNSKIAISSATGGLTYADTATYPSLTELAYVKGLTYSLATKLGSGSFTKTADFDCTTDNGTYYLMRLIGADIDADLPDSDDVALGHTIYFEKRTINYGNNATITIAGGSGDSIKDKDYADQATVTIEGLNTVAAVTKTGTNTWTLSNLTVPQISNLNVTAAAPTAAEFNGEFGTAATVGAGWNIFVDDAGTGNNFFHVVSDGTNWWYVEYTKAV